jgi:DNA-binding beta-propeller fold protein YncE
MEYEKVLDIATSQERAIRPIAVSYDQLTGDICVTDAQYSSFHVLNKYGVEVFRTGGFARLSSPVDGSLTSRGDFVFVGRDEHGVSTIRRLNFMGEPMQFAAEIPIEDWEPRHLAITRDGDILTLDSYHNILTRHDSKTGALLWLTEVTDDGSTELQLGRLVEAPDGRIYVPSGILHNIIVFSGDGERLEAIGEFGTGPGKLVFPVGVAIGPENSILILDRMRHKVLMFDPDHNFLGDFGSMGAGLGQFYHPSAIAASNDGKVYVAQGYGSRVQVFNIRDTKAE